MTWKQTAVLKINNLLCNILLCYTGDTQKSFCQKNKSTHILTINKSTNDISPETNKYCFQFKSSVLKALFNRKYPIHCDTQSVELAKPQGNSLVPFAGSVPCNVKQREFDGKAAKVSAKI